MEKGLHLIENLPLGVSYFTIDEEQTPLDGHNRDDFSILADIKSPDHRVDVFLDSPTNFSHDAFTAIIESGFLLAQKLAIQNARRIQIVINMSKMTEEHKKIVEMHGLNFFESDTTVFFPFVYQTIIHEE